MSETIIEGLFILSAGLITGVITLIATRSGADIEKLKEEKLRLEQQLNEILRQVEAYHLLEDLYANQISTDNGDKAPKTIKTEYRNKVVELHQCDRPELTSNEAKKKIRKFT